MNLFAAKNYTLKTILLLLLTAVTLFLPATFAEAKLTEESARKTWERVAKATELKNLPFSVKEDKVPNAWVANGNSVTVTTALLNMLDDESELYGVLAHEAGHIKLNHYRRTVNRHAGLSVATAILGNLFGSGVGDVAVGVGANLASAGWSREQEVQADDYAVRLAHRMGENPVGLYSAMLKLSKNGTRTQPSGFNSHPPDGRRLQHIKNEILSLDPKAKFPQ